MIHELKTWPTPFRAVVSRRKPYEIRRQDRDFKVGDKLVLREWLPPQPNRVGGEFGRYSGAYVVAEVTHLTPGGEWGLPVGLCVMGVEVLEHDQGSTPLAAILRQAAKRESN